MQSIADLPAWSVNWIVKPSSEPNCWKQISQIVVTEQILQGPPTQPKEDDGWKA